MKNNKKTTNKKKRGGCSAGTVVGATKDTDKKSGDKPRIVSTDDNKGE